MLDLRAIDLENVERLPEQLCKAAIPGAEVVHRDPDVELAGRIQRGAPRVGQGLPLRHLANQPVETGRQSEIRDHRADLPVAEHGRRHIDAHVEIGITREQRLHVALDGGQQLLHQPLEMIRIALDPFDQRPDRPRRTGVFRDPRQHLETDNATRAEIDDRLVVRDDALQEPGEILPHRRVTPPPRHPVRPVIQRAECWPPARTCQSRGSCFRSGCSAQLSCPGPLSRASARRSA